MTLKGEERMQIKIKKVIAAVLMASLVIGCTGCGKEKKEPKPTPKATAKVNEGNANASGDGEGQSDVPLVIACGKFSKQFNPFAAVSKSDKKVVDLTQIPLFMDDRSGRLVYKGIDGEVRQYQGKDYTYYGAADLSIQYDDKKDKTDYRIKIRDDLIFSDGEKVTIDDVIFSLYVFCDNDYNGDVPLKNMPIQGLLNYQADSTKAEKFSKKKIKQYINQKPNQLKRWIRDNITEKGIEGRKAEQLTERQARIFLAQGKGKKVKHISGIQKINEYELTITTTGYEREMSGALRIPVCALHYYGDTSKYDVEKNKFGFRRGDISAILANKAAPVGAGAYRFIKLEDNVAYFNSNELYFLGCPEIAYLQLKDMTEILAEARKELQEKMGSTPAPEVQDTSNSPEEPINPLIEVTEVTEGVVDVISGDFDSEDLRWISAVNSNGELSGNTVNSDLSGDGWYHYIGIHGMNVSVGGKSGSEASSNLRKALATIFSVSRGVLKEKESDLVNLVNYPAAQELWLSPSENEESFAIAYSKDVKGMEIFTDDNEAKAKTELAAGVALGYLEAAGYRTEDRKAVKAPRGASLQYTVWIADGEQNPLYPMLEQAQQTLDTIGITLKLQEITGEALLLDKLRTGTQQIWVGTRPIEDMDLDVRYGAAQKRNIFGIRDKKIKKIINGLQNMMTAQKRREGYQKCFETVLDWGVEVPVCEYQQLTMFSSKRIDADTLPQDSTPYYSWLNEIQKVKMR